MPSEEDEGEMNPCAQRSWSADWMRACGGPAAHTTRLAGRRVSAGIPPDWPAGYVHPILPIRAFGYDRQATGRAAGGHGIDGVKAGAGPGNTRPGLT